MTPLSASCRGALDLTVERTLLDTGEVESVYQMRRSFQQAMEENFRLVVEEATGREVIAYMSSIHVDPDLAIELFVLLCRSRSRARERPRNQRWRQSPVGEAPPAARAPFWSLPP